MNAIFCLDEKNGMLFNKRRQSRDSVLNEHIISLAKGNRLWMNQYSAKLFQGFDISVEESFWEKAEKDDFCFFEQEIKQEHIEKFENVYVFLWNRHYPADVYFKFNLEQEGFSLEKTLEFSGSSHDKITLNIYRRK